jgi:hypothetical protein
LEARKEALENDKRRMLSTWAYSRQAVDIFHGIVSLRSEMVALVSIIAFTGLLWHQARFEEERITKSNGFNEVAPLIRSYNGEFVPINEINKETVVIEVTIRHQKSAKSTEILSKARNQLMN